jgi:DeoR family transcriptional regulator, catabolite repression regulator
MNVKDVMLPLDRFPVVGKTIMLKEALDVMNNLRLGIACIVDNENKLLGILTDGDIRRKLIKVQKPLSAFFVDDALDHAIHSPITSKPDDTLEEAVEIMEAKKIWDLPVVDDQGILIGMLHLHPVVEALLQKRREH